MALSVYRFFEFKGAEACNFIFRFAFPPKHDSVVASEGRDATEAADVDATM